MYGVPVKFNVRGVEKFRTLGGACVSFFAIVLILSYSIFKFTVLVNRDDTMFFRTENLNYYESFDTIESE